MEEKELDGEAWSQLKRDLMRGRNDALEAFTPPIKLTHGTEYIIYEKGETDDSDTD